MKLPPTPRARQGGEVMAAQQAEAGIRVKIENVAWAQWLSGVYGQKADNLSVTARVEPPDFGNFARPHCCWGCGSAEFNALQDKMPAAIKPEEHRKPMGEEQNLLARDAVAAMRWL